MTAVIQTPTPQASAREARFEPMTPDRLDAVVAVEQSAYTYPWTRGNFADSLQSGYQAQLLCADAEAPTDAQGQALLGYFVAMKGVDEVHLLNITVAPAHQQQGWARVMLDGLAIWSRGHGAQWLWLEVRASNTRAKAVYEHYGFRHVGLRKGYYPDGPAGRSQREDALVMSYALGSQ